MGVVKSKVILFKKTRTKDEIVNGMGDFILDDICLSCTTEENLETSEYLLDAEFLIGEDGLFDNLEEETVLKVLLDYGYEYFSIANVTKTLDRIIVVARQITITETLSMWCDDVRAEVKNGQDALQHIVDNSIGNKNITVSSDIPTIATSYFINKTVYDAIHSNDNAFLTRWGGEVQRRQFNITINRKIGKDNGIQIRSRKNLTGFEAETNIDNVVTRIKPIGFDGITIDGYVDSEIIDNYKYVRTKRVEYSNVKVRTENTGENEEVFETLEEAQNELRRLALMEYADGKVDVLRADYTVKFVDLSQTEEYKEYSQIETVNIGDEIQVIEDKLNINITVRAIQRTYDVLDSRVIEIKLSNQAKIENRNNVEALKSRLDELTENVGYMNVTFAKIKDLEVTNATIENLKATKIDVEELNAVKADIVELNADFAEIDTLINGHLTSDNIQSLILTSDKVTVEDAFIKDAMIDSVTANKITSGSINTNNVYISSEDGSMIINGSLQQFKDENGKVRIQIGKDAQGDFTFSLFDENGSGVLIDEKGITENAIADGLIVNDMVAENAGIAGSKLDIDSVVTEINEGTTTIKGAKVALDDNNQTLDVAFSSLKSRVESFAGVEDNNLLKNTAFEEGIDYWIPTNALWTVIKNNSDNPLPWMTANRLYLQAIEHYGDVIQKVDLVHGTTYTVSYWIKGDVGGTIVLAVLCYDDDGISYEKGRETIAMTGEYQKIEVTFTSSNKYTKHGIRFAFTYNMAGDGDVCKVYMGMAKLEEGSVATDWVAPGTSLVEMVEANTTAINVQQGQIDSLISNTTITKENGEVVQLKDEYNSTKDTVDSHTTKIGSLETTVNSVSSKQASMELDLNGFRTDVSSIYATKEELEENTSSLVSKTEFQQTAEDFTFKISQSSSGNLLKNTKLKDGTAYWNLWNWDGSNIASKNISVLEPWTSWNYNKERALKIDANVTTLQGYVRTGFSSASVSVKPNTQYTFSCYTDCHRTNRICFEVYSNNEGDWTREQGIGTVQKVHHTEYDTNYTEWARHEVTFTTKENTTELDIRAYMDTHDNASNNNACMWLALPCLVEGALAMEWIPHENELYDGIVKIDVDGIKVEHTDADTYTSMSAEGFKTTHQDGSFTMLNENGLVRGVGNEFHNYHYLTAVGTVILQGGERYERVSVILPATFDHVSNYRMLYANTSWSLERESNIANPDYMLSSIYLPSSSSVYWYKNSSGHWQNDNFTAHVQIWDAYRYYSLGERWLDCFEYSAGRLTYIITV